jgi:hypothetical protein
VSRFTLQFDGEPIEAIAGQTIAAALIAADRRTFRRTRGAGRPRGLYCGIGACFDCLVVVNGIPSQRACLVEARPGDRVESQEATGWPR